MVRLQRGLTLSQLAGQADISSSYLSLIERGVRRPKPAVIDALAAALQIDRRSLLLAPNAVNAVLEALSAGDIERRMSSLSSAFEEIEAQIEHLRVGARGTGDKS